MTLRVLQFGKFFPPPFGGIETHLKDLVDVIHTDCQVDCLVSNHKSKSEIIQCEGYRVFKMATYGVLFGVPVTPSAVFKLRQLVKKSKYDIVHIHLPNPLAHLCCLFLPRHVKIVATWHSDVIRQKKINFFYQPFMNAFLKRLKAVIYPTPKHISSSIQSKALDDFPSKRHVVPFGIKSSEFEKPVTTDLTQSLKERFKDSFIVMTCGRHVYYKGFSYLIEAMKALDSKIKLLMVGEGPLSSELKNQAQSLDLDEQVYFLNKVSYDDLRALYQLCDIFCLPSVDQSEAFGLVQLEAMSCRKPVICCELNNGVSYVNQHENTGLVVKPRSSQALADAIQRLFENPDLCQEYGSNGYRQVQEKYSLKNMKMKTLEVYHHVLS